jgi:hypothetical protein
LSSGSGCADGDDTAGSRVVAEIGGTHMTVVTTLDVYDMSPEEYRAVMDKLGVERRPEAGIYLHATITTDFGYRVVEIWDRKEGFEDFLEKRLAPATKALGIDRKIEITITPLHNFFAPRLNELPALVSTLPGGPHAQGQTKPSGTN